MTAIPRSDNETVRSEIDDLFTKIFLLSRRLEYISNTALRKDQLTIKQFLLIAAIDSFDEPPSISQLAHKITTSHQNVREIADRLQKRGFIAIERDPKDRRVYRLRTTKENWDYWDSRLDEHERLIFGLFDPFSDEEIHVFDDLVNRFLENTENFLGGGTGAGGDSIKEGTGEWGGSK
jgi:DNA-binding MarR family transcriptional regulator